MGKRNGEIVLGEIGKIAPGKPIYLVPTHVHPENGMGAGAFPTGRLLIRSQYPLTDFAAGTGTNLVSVFAQRSELNATLLKGAEHRESCRATTRWAMHRQSPVIAHG